MVSNKHDICELPHELPNDLNLRTLGNEKIRKFCENFRSEPRAQSSFQNENFIKNSIKSLKTRY